MEFTPPTAHGYISLNHLCDDLIKRHIETKSWRKAAEPYGIYPSMARLIANGYEPGRKIRKKLGLAPVTTVIVIEPGGVVPEGAQVISASVCECGQYFISNHPRRKKCFMCSPYKRRK